MIRRLLFLFTFSFSFTAANAQFFQDTLITGLYSPVAFDFAPDGRIFLTQKGGINYPSVNAEVKVLSPTGNFLGVFYNLDDSTDADFERGLLGIAIDPDFSNNGYVYVYYVHKLNGDERIRIVRFTDNNNVGTNPVKIFDLDVADNLPGVHFGGNLHFRPSEPNQLYFTIGDLGSDQTDTALNYGHMLSNPFGKTLRINKDGTIPTDNPFYDDGNMFTGNCDIIWSYGHRNPFDFCFSPVNDSFYCSENGLITWDEMNIIHRGGNYGWNRCEGFYMNSSTTVLCDDTFSVRPMEVWGAPLPAVTGILFYTGTVLPGLDNHLLVADNDYGNIYDLTLGNPPYYDTVLSRTTLLDVTTTGGLTTIREGSDGCVYAMNGGYTANGSIVRICPSWMSVEESENAYFGLPETHPNPFAGSTTLRYVLKQPATLSVTLYDLSGRSIVVPVEENQQAGVHELVIDAQKLNLTPGMYCCVLRCGDAVGTVLLSVVE